MKDNKSIEKNYLSDSKNGLVKKSLIKKPILTIAIPTFNRCFYLSEILKDLIPQCETVDPQNEFIEILISNNSSTDDTNAFLQNSYINLSRLTYYINSNNIGGINNIFYCTLRSSGTYVWILGDDELIFPNSILLVLNELKVKSDTGLFILPKTISLGLEGKYFKSYKDFALFSVKNNPHNLLAHTLISANIFRKDIFNNEVSAKTIKTLYAHMYGLQVGLANTNTGVTIFNFPIVEVRKERAPMNWGKQIWYRHTQYLFFLSNLYGIKLLKIYGIKHYLCMKSRNIVYDAIVAVTSQRFRKNLKKGIFKIRCLFAR
ncbi:glycosyltransferase family 2 protein [Pigmentibacter sp. JX0631]|uniref:glycosyltransferase family A protein n=1 Tax=Pigmentibacter sp. JX0631 TaxID=2976982 RepID=UPI0024688C7D|nr:glycosyltransferase family 2 protein [Pigmentibacter sp. JX0631]WGL60829.1 glycosyltransferase family 2 protein [Pigmentibacter sp. JX0631]